jgi:spermidine synthase
VPDLRCERLLGHLPALFHPAPKKTLTVGLGTGITAGCFVLHPEVDQITICEIEPVVRDAAAAYFARENHDVAGEPRADFHFDDARHFLATTDQRFDVITSDPVNSWVRGAAALYSAEYFELCKRHLNPGGIVVEWIPLYEKDLATAKCELATFLQAFPHATLWTSWTEYATADQRHDVIAVGQLEPRTIDLAKLNGRIQANPKLKAALNEVHIGTVPELLGQYIARGEDLQPWLAGAEINRDRSLRLEYLAGISRWMNQATEIFRQMTAYRRYPTELLRNDGHYKDEVLRRLGLWAGSQ